MASQSRIIFALFLILGCSVFLISARPQSITQRKLKDIELIRSEKAEDLENNAEGTDLKGSSSYGYGYYGYYPYYNYNYYSGYPYLNSHYGYGLYNKGYFGYPYYGGYHYY